ncbi:MAG: hypothetical protein ACP5RT_01665 [Candidatus Micrarchaeia archaeon]
MEKCLLLAFEDSKDLSKELAQFDRVDAYGPLAKVDTAKLKNLHIFRQFFWIENYKLSKEKYSLCIIRHPDIWGEPINWLRAIAAIAESVNGKLVGVFWMPSEIVAFDFFLTSIIGKNLVLETIYTSHSRACRSNSFVVEYRILKTQKGMLSFYRSHKMEIMRRFYQTVGTFYWEMSIDKARQLLKKKHMLDEL